MSRTTCANRLKIDCKVPFSSISLTLKRLLLNWCSYFFLFPCAFTLFFAQEKTVFRAFNRGTKNCVVVGSPPLHGSWDPAWPLPRRRSLSQTCLDPRTGAVPQPFYCIFHNLVNDAKYQIGLSLESGWKRFTGFKLLDPICPESYPPLLGQMCACAPRAAETGRRLSNFSLTPPAQLS